MKKLLLALLLLPVFANGQIMILGGCCPGNTILTFATWDSLNHYIPLPTDSTEIVIDTSMAMLWQIGNTMKPVFSNGTVPMRGIMTDTLHTYPANANDYFEIKIKNVNNTVVDIWHRYQTDSLHAGGIIEFSTDTGLTWMNIANCGSVLTQNIYAPTDTIISGQPAFTGTSNGEQFSRFQFTNCIAVRTTTTFCYGSFNFPNQIYVRFRFASDTTVSSLSGWMIDSVEIENTGCGLGISNINVNKSIEIFPNPATTQLTITAPNAINEVTITNLLGQRMETSPDRSILRQSSGQGEEVISVDVSGLPAGVYFVKVNGSEVRKFLKE